MPESSDSTHPRQDKKDRNHTMSSDPYLSIVAVARNDDHGGDQLTRMQRFIDGIFIQCNRYGIRTELILVEWNPPVDTPRLEYALQWPGRRKDGAESLLEIRVITVSPDLHSRYSISDKLALFQMIGKNVGIRRARGRFILATNIDLIFSNELMAHLSKSCLTPGCVYRVNRVDVSADVLRYPNTDEILKNAIKKILRVHSHFIVHNCETPLESVKSTLKFPISFGYRILRKILFDYPLWHFYACGDFTLMERSDWENLRGYSELEVFSLNIDSLLLIAAYYSGLKECILPSPMEIYHIEHSPGSGWSPGLGEHLLFERLERDGIPYLHWNDCARYAREMRMRMKTGEEIIRMNGEKWGLADYDLPEKRIVENPDTETGSSY